MSYRTVGVNSVVVDCDVCRESLQDGDWVMQFATEAQADTAAVAAGWVQTVEETVCLRENLPHSRARTGQAA